MSYSKALFFTTILATAAWWVPTSQADIADAVFIDQGLGQDRCIEFLEPIVEQFAKRAKRGQSLPFYDADTTEQFSELKVPDSRVYDKASPRRILRANEAAIGGIRQFCTQPVERVQSTLLYDTLRFIGNNTPHLEEGDLQDVLVIAFPPAIDPQSPTTAMLNGLVPGDGHPTSQRIHSPHGLADETELLSGNRIHIVLAGDEWIVSPTHAAEAERYVAHQVMGRSGTLSSYESDVRAVLGRIQSGAAHRFTYRPLSLTDAKLVMIDFGPPPPSVANIFEHPLSSRTLSAAELSSPLDDVSIGLSWECACDVDLLAMARPASPPLYWNNRTTQDGRFIKDYRSPNAERGFETVAFERPVLLGQLMIAANLYAGRENESITGKIRISIGHDTFEAPFVISATTGNLGAGLSHLVEAQVSPNDGWTIIDPNSVVVGH